jgi:hypothetical protein
LEESRSDALWICQVLADSLNYVSSSETELNFIIQISGFVDALFTTVQITPNTEIQRKSCRHALGLFSNLMVTASTCQILANDYRLIPSALKCLQNVSEANDLLLPAIHVLIASSRPLVNRVAMIHSVSFVQTIWNLNQFVVASFPGETIDENMETENNQDDSIPPQINEFQDEILYALLCLLHNLSKHPDISMKLASEFHLDIWCDIIRLRSAEVDNIILARRILENCGLEEDFKEMFSVGTRGDAGVVVMISSSEIYEIF